MRIVAAIALVSAVSCSSSDGGTGGSTGQDGGGAGAGGGSSSSIPPCADVCPPIVAAACSGGPVDQTDCVSGCDFIRSGPCLSLYEGVFECGGASPVYACTSGGQVTVTGCESEMDSLYACLASG